MSITIANITFDNVDYDEGGDVLYLHRGDPVRGRLRRIARGPRPRFDASGDVVGITVTIPLGSWSTTARSRSHLPPQHVDLDGTQLDDVLVRRSGPSRRR
jgi:hypothetical protein